MKKNSILDLLGALVPVGITCGPMGMIPPESRSGFAEYATWMLVCGLMVMYLKICRQQNLIEELWTKLRDTPLSSSGTNLS